METVRLISFKTSPTPQPRICARRPLPIALAQRLLKTGMIMYFSLADPWIHRLLEKLGEVI